MPTTQAHHRCARPPKGNPQLAALLPTRHDSARCPLLHDKDDQIATDTRCTFHKALATRFGLHLADPCLQPHHVAHLTPLVLGSTRSRSQLQCGNTLLNPRSPHVGICTSSTWDTRSTPVPTTYLVLLHVCSCGLLRAFSQHSYASLTGLLFQVSDVFTIMLGSRSSSCP